MTKTKHVLAVALEAGRLLFRRAPIYLLATLSIVGIVYAAELAYYRFMPGNWFLHVSTAKVDDLDVDQPLVLTLCRDTRYPNIKASSSRSFYQYVAGNKLVASGEYEFKATYEGDNHCQVIHIPAGRHPSKSGDYYVHTESTFQVIDDRFRFTKVISYDSNRFHIYDTQRSVEDQIKALQQEIDQLRGELGAGLSVVSRPTVGTAEPSSGTAQTTTHMPAATPKPPETSSPVAPPPPPVASPNIIQRLLDSFNSLI